MLRNYKFFFVLSMKSIKVKNINLTNRNSGGMMSQKLAEYYTKNQKRSLEEYFAFLRFQSVSSESEYTPQVLACASWVENYLKNIGFTTQLWKTPGHPVVFGSYLKHNANKPTLLIYNHYDVQPVDPIELWETPPL